jgi:hypothetical protein
MNSISKNRLIYEAEFLPTKLFRPKRYKLALLKVGWSLSATDPIILMILLLYNVNLSIMQGETNRFV